MRKRSRTATYLLLVLLALLSSFPAFAIQTSEPILVRVVTFDPGSRVYNLTCVPPGPANIDRTWSIRPDTSVAVQEFHSTVPTALMTLDRDVMYHISCGAQNGTTYLMTDFHVDRRTSLDFDPGRPYITISNTSGTHYAAQCHIPANVTQYSVNWVMNSRGGNTQLPQFNNRLSIETDVPHPAQWEITCNIWDTQRSQYLRAGLSIEFFAAGFAYVPSIDGCIPGDACPYVGAPTRPLAWVGAWPYNTTNVTIPSGNTTSNQSNTTNATICYTSVQNIPAVCTGGIVTSDTWNGGRSITCAQGGNSVALSAWNKPDNTFEMYRQSSSGAAPRICLGTTCIQNNGFAKSPPFPICLNGTNTTIPQGNQTNQTNTTGNQTNATQPAVNVTLSNAPWFPQGHNTILVCNASGLTPVSYDFRFGDGAQNLNYGQNNAWHTYATPGLYAASCTARNATVNANATLSIVIA